MRSFTHLLYQDHLKDHIARGDLEKAGAPHLSLPKAIAPFAAIASTCHTLLFLDHFPRADTAQNQAALHAPPKGIALTARVALPHVVFATGRDHVVHSDGWLALRIIVLAIITLNGGERSRGMAALPCSRLRMTAMSWFLPQELGTLGRQIHVATKRVQVHGFNGGSGVAKLGIERSCRCGIHFSMPVLRGIASPSHLHIHELVRRKDGHNLVVDLWVLLEGIQRQTDPFITDGPHDHVFTVIRDWGHRNLHHHLWRVGQESPHGQKLAKLPVALTPLCRGLGSSKVVGIQELLHLILGLLQIGLVFLGRFSLAPAGTLGSSRASHTRCHKALSWSSCCRRRGTKQAESRSGSASASSAPHHRGPRNHHGSSLGLDAAQLPLASSRPPRCKGKG